MAQIPKQDRTHPRTSEDLVRKFNFEKTNKKVEEISDNISGIVKTVKLVEDTNKEIKSVLELKVDQASLGVYAKTEDVNKAVANLTAELETKVTDEEVVAKLGVYAKTEDVESVRLDLRETEESLNSNISAELELKIGKDENDQIVSMLNASADIITMNSNRLRINSSKFKLKDDGSIEATGGILGGWVITDTEIHSANGIQGKWRVDTSSGTSSSYAEYEGYMFYFMSAFGFGVVIMPTDEFPTPGAGGTLFVGSAFDFHRITQIS